jgi:hypothetical protein
LGENRSFDQVLHLVRASEGNGVPNFVFGQPNRSDFGRIDFGFGIAGNIEMG